VFAERHHFTHAVLLAPPTCHEAVQCAQSPPTWPGTSAQQPARVMCTLCEQAATYLPDGFSHTGKNSTSLMAKVCWKWTRHYAPKPWSFLRLLTSFPPSSYAVTSSCVNLPIPTDLTRCWHSILQARDRSLAYVTNFALMFGSAMQAR
jgi:hypothetical protein